MEGLRDYEGVSNATSCCTSTLTIYQGDTSINIKQELQDHLTSENPSFRPDSHKRITEKAFTVQIRSEQLKIPLINGHRIKPVYLISFFPSRQGRDIPPPPLTKWGKRPRPALLVTEALSVEAPYATVAAPPPPIRDLTS